MEIWNTLRGTWAIYREECPHCYWQGPHGHLLRSDGTLGVVVDALEQIREQVWPS